MLAARRGKTDLVKLLLSKGADPKAKNCHGETAASLALFGGYRALAEQLIATPAPRQP
jgi:ankyrin repeat protein